MHITTSEKVEDYIQADCFIKRTLTPKEETMVQKYLRDTLSTREKCLIKPLGKKINRAKKVKVSVIVNSSIKLQIDSLGVAYHKIGMEMKKKVIANYLLGSVFRKSCIIGSTENNHTLEVHILDVDHIGDCTITNQTEIEIVPDNGISSSNLPQDSVNYKPIHERKEDMDRKISRIKVKLPGLERAAKSLLEILMYPLVYADLTKKIGIEPPKGVLLYGPPGVGKTSIVKCVVEICDAHLISISGAEIHGPHQGESEENLRNYFAKAQKFVSSDPKPCILFIDEIDSIAPQRNNSQGRESRIVAQLLTLMDGVISRGRLVIIGATNRPNAVDSAVRRPGRLDREIGIDVPTESERLQILQNLTSHLNLSPNTSLKTIASQTVGYVGADLVALIRESTLYAIANSESDEVVLTMSGFKHGLATVSPSTVRAAGSLTVSVPDLTWEDVGGYAEVKKKIKQAVEWPLTKKEKLEKLGVQSVKGILMYGPPGCCKTTLVKVVASTTKSTFLSINGASIYSPFVGDSEATIRSVFARARTSSPSIIFFDELDAIVGKRQLEGNGRAGGDSVQERVLSTLLNEMDGIESSSTILVMAATNRPDLIDAALLRPGRFDRLIYIPPPDEEARIQIMKIHTRNMPLSESVNLESLAKEMHGYTGADIQSVCTEAAIGAIRKISRNREDFAGELAEKTVDSVDFLDALKIVKPSISVEMNDQYHKFMEKFGKGH